MAIKILPQEFLFQEHLNPIQIQTTVSKELLDDPRMFLRHIRHFNLAVGTVMLVQVLNEAKDQLLHEAGFRVTSAVESLHGIEDEYGSKVRPQTQYQVERWTEWRSSSLAPVAVVEDAPRVVEQHVPGEGELKWNPTKMSWDVMVAGEVWTTVFRLDGEDKTAYRDRATAIAAGALPKAA